MFQNFNTIIHLVFEGISKIGYVITSKITSQHQAKQKQQGNQRWQIPRPATCQCLATFTPLKSKILIFFRDVISLLARVFILLIDTATQEVPMKNI